jgi:ABC-type multidrug transport system ATPase subunit
MSLLIQAVQKTYPNGIKALKGIDLEIKPGEVFGLVGPNGAGKSTLLKVACGLLRAETGSVCYGEHELTGNPQASASFIGLMPDPLGVYTDITAHDYLEFFARVMEIPEEERAGRIAAVVGDLELGPWLDEEVETLSAGWQRRLALGRILLARTPVLLLDEPAAGLDIPARKELLAIVRGLANEKRAIIISSHILPELEDLADRFGILDQGAWRDVIPGKTFFTRQELKHGLDGTYGHIRCDDPEAACQQLRKAGFAVDRDDEIIRFRITEGDPQMADIVSTLCNHGRRIFSAEQHCSGLGDLVLNALNTTTGEEA